MLNGFRTQVIREAENPTPEELAATAEEREVARQALAEQGCK